MLCFPLAAYLSVHHNRVNVIALGAMLWAIATFFVGASSTFVEVAISRALNGVGLAMVIPAIQSLVADAAHPEKRGLAFGWLQFTGNLGSVFGNVFSVLLAGTTVFGLAGWRASFHILAASSVLVAFFVYRLAIDPRYKEGQQTEYHHDSSTNPASALKETLTEAKFVVRIPTFQAIVAQGVAGTFPWAALSFASMWLELIGFSHNVTAAIIGSFTISGSLGGLFGGWLGDVFARHSPNTGRIILAQFSSSIGIPFGAVILLVLPYNSSTAFQHGALFFAMGFLMSWCGTGTNNPIFAEIVPQKMRTSIYALDRSFESLLASFAPPLVGILAEDVFGYVVSAPQTSEATSRMPDTENARALGKALFVAFGVPFTFCCLLYSILYWTYPRDRDKAQAEWQLSQEGSPGITEINNLKPGYFSLSKDADLVGDEPAKIEVTVNNKSSGEEQHMLS
ncbi:hypothetical protein GOP47_0004747 [Adiantum capillus-veneris]|uniref:Major facilitator superfamily (MFS) profile domain-containing protein n=1 Tax=Adiantum capillus-veneris TaxID=13818 RepID=A0A9D4ZKR1_ADICA|nr:hypothetical protein GOP47_0004747 [Adiantum capillus-veneris]